MGLVDRFGNPIGVTVAEGTGLVDMDGRPIPKKPEPVPVTYYGEDERVPRGDVWTLHHRNDMKVCHPEDVELLLQQGKLKGANLERAPRHVRRQVKEEITASIKMRMAPGHEPPKNTNSAADLAKMLPEACAAVAAPPLPPPEALAALEEFANANPELGVDLARAIGYRVK